MRRLSTVLLPLALAFALAASARAVPLRTGDLLVVTDFGVVYTVDRATGATQHFADLPISSGGHLAFDAAGNVLVQARASAEAFRIDRNTGAVSSLASGAFLAGSNGNSSGIAFDSDQGLILDSTFMVSPTSIKGRVVRVDAGGTQTLVSEGIYFPNALTTEADGSILVASDFLFLGAGTSYNNGVVFRIDPATGAISVVASGGNLSPPGSARDLAIADDGAIAAVAGPFLLTFVDPVTGAQSLRLPTSIDPGTDFDFATGVVSDGAGGFYLTVGHDQLDETWPGGVIHYVPGGALSAVTDPSAFYSPWDVAVVPVPEPSTLALLALGCAVLARLRASASS